MKEETFDYSKVPHNFGLCATDTCPYTDTCLRQIAYTYAPSNNIFLYVLNPKAIESTAGKCKYYCSNKKVRYAKGFIHTAEAISVGQSGTFRYRLMGYPKILSEAERGNFALTNRAATSHCNCP